MISPRVTQMSPAVWSPKCKQIPQHLAFGRREVARDRTANPRPRRSLPRSRREASISLSSPKIRCRMPRHSRDPPSSPRVAIRPRPHRGRRCRVWPARAPRVAPCRRRSRRPDDRSRADAAFRGPANARHGARCDALVARLGGADSVRQHDVAEQHFGAGTAAPFKILRPRQAGKTRRWSACPCRAIAH